MLALRPYQQEALSAIAEAESRGIKRPLVALPTGTGKTVVFAHLITKRPGRSLILAHRDELINQAVDKMQMVNPGVEMGVVKAERNEHTAPIVVASVQTLSRPERLTRVAPDFSTLVVDEAHHSAADTYRNVLAYFGVSAPLVVGFTATPERADKKGLADIFEEIVYQKQLVHMIQDGYLSDMRCMEVLLNCNLDRVTVRSGDFAAGALGNALMAAKAPWHILEAFQKHADSRKTIIFTPLVEIAQTVAREFRGAGIEAEALHAGTPDDSRRAMLERFHRGEIQVIANCGILTEGFDEPSVDCIVIARPTKSKVLYMQMLGRGTRLYPGKSDCLLLDVVGASTRHEPWTATKLFETKPKEGETLVEAIERGEREQAELLAGELVAREIALFARRPLRWVKTPIQGRWVLSLAKGEGMIKLVPKEDDLWDVVQVKRNRTKVVHGEGLSLSYAQGLGETIVNRLDQRWLLASDARWVNAPASEGQKGFLVARGAWVEGMTKGQAGHRMTEIIGDWY